MKKVIMRTHLLNPIEFDFVDFPRRKIIADYERVLLTYLNKIRNDDVLAVYRIGSIANPGISDLDVIVIVKDSLQRERVDLYSIEELSEDERYIFMHNAYILPKSIAHSINAVFNVENINLIYGADILKDSVYKYDVRYEYAAKVACIVDFSMDILKALALSVVGRKIYVRSLLCLLLSLRHTIILCNSILSERISGGDEYIEKILNIRNNAFDLDIAILKKEIVKLIVAAFDLLDDIFDKINILFDSLEVLAVNTVDRIRATGVLVYDYKFYCVFTEKYSKGGLLRNIINNSFDSDSMNGLSLKSRCYAILNRIVVILPPNLYYHYYTYAQKKGLIGYTVKKRIFGQANLRIASLPYTIFLAEKIALANKQADFLVNNGLNYGQMILYSFFPNYTSMVGRILERIHIYILRRVII